MNASVDRRSWAKGVLVLIVFALGAMALSSGGLGLAPLGALGGLGAIVFATLERRWAPPTLAAWVGAALLAWAALSLAWSTYDRPGNVVRTVLGSWLYIGFALLCLTTDGPGRRLARAGVLLCVAASGAVFGFELATHGAITGSHRVDNFDPAQVWRNLGHGLSAWIVLLPAALAAMQLRSVTTGILGAGLIVIAFACAIGYGLTSNLAGLIAAMLGAALAWRWPRAAVWGVGALTVATILAAPAFGRLARDVPEGVRAVLPDSWELRLEAWSYTLERIGERPIVGHGFDASRTMTETIEFKGAPVEVLPLHPHNAGLHLWLETGLVGAALAAALALLVARHVARAPGLSRSQAVAVVAAAAGYLMMAQVSYGVWQEWWIAAAAWGAAGVALIGPGPARPPDAANAGRAA